MLWDDGHDDSRAPRIIFPRHVKNALFTAQKGKCSYCGRTNRIRYLEIDHKFPLSRGGSNETDNLQLLCTPCNMRKGIQSDEEFRWRYQRLLPPDGTIPNPPIAQDDFSAETQLTTASPEVRAIYHQRFIEARYGRFAEYGASQRGGCGLLAAAAVAIVFALALLALAN